MDLRERVIGSVLGLALGDALGAPFHGLRADRVPHPLPAFQLPWMGFSPGVTTDATAMARNLVRSLVERGGFDAVDLARRHVGWLATDPPRVDSLTRVVLTGIRDGDPNAAHAYVQDRGPEVSSGNGSVMCCAPLGAAYARHPDALAIHAPALSAVTHWDERCRTACLAVALTVSALIRGEPPDRAVVDAVEAVAGREGAEELEYLVGEAGRARPIDGPDRGFALFTAGIALQVAGEGLGFEEGLARVVGMGGDTDANGAVAGALLGALHGTEGLPKEWLQRLEARGAIEDEAHQLAELAERIA
jgi:ADP-ribosyl-[dinitrogen reductase] hydrolase